MNEEDLKEDLRQIRYRQTLILTALRNLLNGQDNKHKENDHLMEIIERELK